MRQRHREHRVAGLAERGVRGQVGAGARVRLEVGVLGAEQLLGPGDADLLGLVDLLAAAVVAPAGVTLGVLVRQRRAERGQHRRRGEVLAGDQLQAAAQPVQLAEHDVGDLRVLRLQGVEVRAPERACCSSDRLLARLGGGSTVGPGRHRGPYPGDRPASRRRSGDRVEQRSRTQTAVCPTMSRWAGSLSVGSLQVVRLGHVRHAGPLPLLAQRAGPVDQRPQPRRRRQPVGRSSPAMPSVSRASSPRVKVRCREASW